jgi:pimeloyl-ACP methyl ester carboxylesterase
MALPSILLVHGAANGAWVWDFWRARLKELGWRVNVLDLRGHGRSLPIDFSLVGMDDYVNDLESVTMQIAAAEGRHPIVGGWSMGGLVAMMYAARRPDLPALLLFAPSPPVEVAGRADPDVVRETPREPYGPELYGVFPDDFEASRPALAGLTESEMRSVLEKSAGALESGFARRQRQRGISIPAGSIRAPALVVYGDQDAHFKPETQRRLAIYLAADSLAVENAGHWGIVYSEQAVAETGPRVDRWLRANLRNGA